MIEWLNRFFCKITGNHIYDEAYLFDSFAVCKFCKRDLLNERCSGWQEEEKP